MKYSVLESLILDTSMKLKLWSSVVAVLVEVALQHPSVACSQSSLVKGGAVSGANVTDGAVPDTAATSFLALAFRDLGVTDLEAPLVILF